MESRHSQHTKILNQNLRCSDFMFFIRWSISIGISLRLFGSLAELGFYIGAHSLAYMKARTYIHIQAEIVK